ncbi:MAG TPA: tetratricopeptide repeat protein [Myxococcales bacterium]|nr:tetratricopeptide repeat protein [Myxococcales bacterium]
MDANEPAGKPEPEPEPEAEVPPVQPVPDVEPAPAPDWKRRESLGSALAQIAVAAVLLGAGVFWRYHRAEVRLSDAAQVKAARTQASSDAPEDLKAALAALKPAAARGVREANALSARLNLELWRTHGLAEHQAPAREALALAEQADAPTEDRYAARALVLLQEGKAGEAEALYRDVERRGGQSPWLSYALGRALQQQGDGPGAAGAYQRAVEAGWKDPGLLASCGEALLELDRPGDAARAFEAALGREPGHVRSLAGLALARLFEGGASTLAEKAVEAGLARRDALTPGQKARVLAAAAELERQQSKLDLARRDAGDAVAAMKPAWPLAERVQARVLAGAKAAPPRGPGSQSHPE